MGRCSLKQRAALALVAKSPHLFCSFVCRQPQAMAPPLCSADKAVLQALQQEFNGCTSIVWGCLSAAWTLAFSEGSLFVCMLAEPHPTTADPPSACGPQRAMQGHLNTEACALWRLQHVPTLDAPDPPAVRAPHAVGCLEMTACKPMGHCCSEPHVMSALRKNTIAVACLDGAGACVMRHC